MHTLWCVFEWDPAKARTNRRKHGVDFTDAVAVFFDDRARTLLDETADEERFVTLGLDALGRVLVVVWCWRNEALRLISARRATRRERSQYEEDRGRPMKRQYDFSAAKRGAVLEQPPGKTRVTIRLDDDVLDWFRNEAHAAGGGNYQTLINAALREHMSSRVEPLEDTLRRVVREELRRKAG